MGLAMVRGVKGQVQSGFDLSQANSGAELGCVLGPSAGLGPTFHPNS